MRPQLRKRLFEEFDLRGTPPSTRITYSGCIDRFERHFGVSAAKLGKKQVREFLLHLVAVEQRSAMTHNVNVAALVFLYARVLGRPATVAGIPRRKLTRKLAEVLTPAQVERLLAAQPSLTHRMALMLAYGAGLRIGEVLSLRVEHIDSAAGVIHVRNAKRWRDRDVMLAPQLLAALRAYWLWRRPPGPELFPGLEAFDWPFQPGFDKSLVLELARLDFVRRHDDLVVTGKSGTGKSHILEAIALRACKEQMRVRYARCVDMLDDLYAGLADGSYPKRLRGWASADLLVIDDVGLGQVKKRESEPTAAHTLYDSDRPQACQGIHRRHVQHRAERLGPLPRRRHPRRRDPRPPRHARHPHRHRRPELQAACRQAARRQAAQQAAQGRAAGAALVTPRGNVERLTTRRARARRVCGVRGSPSRSLGGTDAGRREARHGVVACAISRAPL